MEMYPSPTPSPMAPRGHRPTNNNPTLAEEIDHAVSIKPEQKLEETISADEEESNN